METLDQESAAAAEARFLEVQGKCPVLGRMAIDMARDLYNLSNGQWHGDDTHDRMQAEAEMAVAEQSETASEASVQSAGRRSLFDSLEFTTANWFSRNVSAEPVAPEPTVAHKRVVEERVATTAADTIFDTPPEAPVTSEAIRVEELIVTPPQQRTPAVEIIEEVPAFAAERVETVKPLPIEEPRVVSVPGVADPAETQRTMATEAEIIEEQRQSFTQQEDVSETANVIAAVPEVVAIQRLERVVNTEPEVVVEAVPRTVITPVRVVNEKAATVTIVPIVTIESLREEVPIPQRLIEVPGLSADTRNEAPQTIEPLPAEPVELALPANSELSETSPMTLDTVDIEVLHTVPDESIAEIYEIEDESVRMEVVSALSRLPSIESEPTVVTLDIEQAQVAYELPSHQEIFEQMTQLIGEESETTRPLVEKVAQAIANLQEVITDPQSGDEAVQTTEAELLVACQHMLRQLDYELPVAEVRNFARQLLVAHMIQDTVPLQAEPVHNILEDEQGTHERKHFGVILNWRRLLRLVRQQSDHTAILGRLMLANAV